MSLGAPRIWYGIHSLSPYQRSDKMPYGILKVIGAASIGIASSVEELFGGSQKFGWAAESKTFKASMDCKVKAYPGFLFSLFMGATVTDNAAEALGSVVALENVFGTSVLAATGLASVGITAGNEGNVKMGKYMVKAVDATHVDVYAYSDVDFPRGSTPLSYQTDLLKITAAPLLIAMGATTVIPKTGLELVGGGGAIGFTAGDTATFESKPKNTGSSDIVIGAASTALPAFGAILLGQKRATAEMVELEAHNCVAEGFPLPFDEQKFSETSVKVTCLYDSVSDRVFTIRTVAPTTFL